MKMKSTCKRQLHGMTGTRFYRIWKGIQGRCYDKTDHAYIGYGSVGIGSKWKGNFLKFKREMYETYVEHVDKHGEKNTSIDRLDNTKDYSLKNCKWSTQLEQARNKRRTLFLRLGGRRLTLKEWAIEKNMAYCTLRQRVQTGWPTKYLFIKAEKGRNQSSEWPSLENITDEQITNNGYMQ